MTRLRVSRRDALSASALGALGIGFGVHSSVAQSAPRPSAVSRLGVGAIGLRYQGSVIARQVQPYGDVVAVCDVDRNVRDQAKAAFGSTAHSSEDYRELLARKDVDVVTIGSPDHWHTKMVIDACRAGKDVYCEKPLTLTIDEGKILTKVVRETGRVVQVGEVLARQGVELLIVELSGYDIHLDVNFLMIDRDLALLNPNLLPFSFLEELGRRGIRYIETDPADDPWIVNSLAVAPGKVLMPEGATNRTLDRLAAAGVTWITVPYDAVQKNGGGLHCSTTPLRRDGV